jgi:hypothetical protein
MNSSTLFGMALGLQLPCQVNEISFTTNDSNQKELHLYSGVFV